MRDYNATDVPAGLKLAQSERRQARMRDYNDRKHCHHILDTFGVGTQASPDEGL